MSAPEPSASPEEIDAVWSAALEKNDWSRIVVECPHCGNQWMRKGRSLKAQCAKCRHHFTIDGSNVVSMSYPPGYQIPDEQENHA